MRRFPVMLMIAAVFGLGAWAWARVFVGVPPRVLDALLLLGYAGAAWWAFSVGIPARLRWAAVIGVAALALAWPLPLSWRAFVIYPPLTITTLYALGAYHRAMPPRWLADTLPLAAAYITLSGVLGRWPGGMGPLVVLLTAAAASMAYKAVALYTGPRTLASQWGALGLAGLVLALGVPGPFWSMLLPGARDGWQAGLMLAAAVAGLLALVQAALTAYVGRRVAGLLPLWTITLSAASVGVVAFAVDLLAAYGVAVTVGGLALAADVGLAVGFSMYALAAGLRLWHHL